MNEQIQQEIVKYLQAFQSSVEKAGTFTAEQAPLIIQEFISWQFYNSILHVGYCLVGLYVCYRLSRTLTAHPLEAEKKNGLPTVDDAFYVPIAIVGIFVGVCFLIPLCLSINGMVKTLVAPRIVVIEKISELVKK